MLEEPEQNLEPQMQRHCVKSIRELCGADTQVLMSTHSPYVLSSGINLDGVYRLVRSDDGKLKAVDLASISADRMDFSRLRKSMENDMELLEVLFTPLVIIWEGDCEAGLYPALMRQIEDYPSEWLRGVAVGGDFVKKAYDWFASAEYQTFIVLDGDKPDTLNSLLEKGAPFLALPSNRKIEHIIADELSRKDSKIIATILLSAIGSSGFISWHDDFRSVWPSLAKLFSQEGCERALLPTETALAKLKDATSPIQGPENVSDILRVLEKNKNRRMYESMAGLLHEEQAIPNICMKVLGALKDIWLKNLVLGQYQLDEYGEIKDYIL
jgi:hypothetical protein